MNEQPNERPAWVLPGRKMVKVTLRDGQRIGQILVDRGDKVTVEYKTPAGYFACRELRRSQIEVL